MTGQDPNNSNANSKGDGAGDGNGNSPKQFTQAEVDAMISAKEKELLDKNANAGRTEKEIREKVEAEVKAKADKEKLEADGKLKEVNEILEKEKNELTTKLETATEQLKVATGFVDSIKENTKKENDGLLAEMEKGIKEDKKEQFKILKSSLPEDPFKANTQLKSMKSLFISTDGKRNSPNPKEHENGGNAGILDSIAKIEVNNTGNFNPFKK